MSDVAVGLRQATVNRGMREYSAEHLWVDVQRRSDQLEATVLSVPRYTSAVVFGDVCTVHQVDGKVVLGDVREPSGARVYEVYLTPCTQADVVDMCAQVRAEGLHMEPWTFTMRTKAEEMPAPGAVVPVYAGFVVPKSFEEGLSPTLRAVAALRALQQVARARGLQLGCATLCRDAGDELGVLRSVRLAGQTTVNHGG